MDKYVGPTVIGLFLLFVIVIGYLYLRYEYQSVQNERERDRQVFMNRLTITCIMMFTTREFNDIPECLIWLEDHKQSLETSLRKSIALEELSEVATKAYKESRG